MYRHDDVSIRKEEAKALRALLKVAGATRVVHMKNGAINATFKTWKAVEKANKDLIVPLETLFGDKDLRSAFDNPFAL